jgi:formylglycine-generating enzyme required for sulfatase activity
MGRHALLVGVSEFVDTRLARLNAPINDVIKLKGILEDSSRGGFDSVDLSPNEDFLAVRDRLSHFYHERAPDDLLLLYYSGHGILGRGNRLFLATTGSSVDAPRARSISANEIREFIEECRAERQIVVLDCCHSGAFAGPGKAGAPPPAITAETFSSAGTGLYVLAAADTLQYAWDGAELRLGDQAVNKLSLFTSWLADGLENGEAAPDEEKITIDALYQYLFRRARSEGAPSTPQRFVQEGVGDLVISANPLAGAARVDPKIAAALDARQYLTRLGAVHELSRQIAEGSVPAARGARRLLERRLQIERHISVHQAITGTLAGDEARRTEPGRRTVQESRPAVATRSSATAAAEAGGPPIRQEDAHLPDLAFFSDAPFAPELVVMPAGEFMMGSGDEEEVGYEVERPQHRVTIAQRFAIGRYPVTFDEYDRFCQATGRNKPEDQGWGRGRQPAINVSLQDAQEYLAWLSQETGWVYRLPSEAEWEYACRAGTTARYSFGDAITPKDANYADSGLSRTSEVGTYPANSWGLYDMHGNVWEWVEDDWHENYRDAPSDGSAWKDAKAGGSPRLCVLRGGSWDPYPRDCRSACRGWFGTDAGEVDIGFRVARTLS